MKCSHIENSDIKEEDEPEGDDDMTSDVTLDLIRDRRACDTSQDTSTTSNSMPRCSKQSKCFNTVWLKERKHFLKYEKGVGMFCLLCQKYMR